MPLGGSVVFNCVKQKIMEKNDLKMNEDLSAARFGNQPLYTLSLNQLEKVFKGWTREVLNEAHPEQNQMKLYTRKEVCHLFDISNPTIIDYEKRGLLLGSRIGHKIYYSQEDIDNALQRLPKAPKSKI